MPAPLAGLDANFNNLDRNPVHGALTRPLKGALGFGDCPCVCKPNAVSLPSGNYCNYTEHAYGVGLTPWPVIGFSHPGITHYQYVNPNWHAAFPEVVYLTQTTNCTWTGPSGGSRTQILTYPPQNFFKRSGSPGSYTYARADANVATSYVGYAPPQDLGFGPEMGTDSAAVVQPPTSGDSGGPDGGPTYFYSYTSTDTDAGISGVTKGIYSASTSYQFDATTWTYTTTVYYYKWSWLFAKIPDFHGPGSPYYEILQSPPVKVVIGIFTELITVSNPQTYQAAIAEAATLSAQFFIAQIPPLPNPINIYWVGTWKYARIQDGSIQDVTAGAFFNAWPPASPVSGKTVFAANGWWSANIMQAVSSVQLIFAIYLGNEVAEGTYTLSYFNTDTGVPGNTYPNGVLFDGIPWATESRFYPANVPGIGVAVA